MPKIFTPENRNDIRKELLECGFSLLKQGGLTAVNIDVITERCFIAKGTFYNFFKNKSDYMYQMALYERNRAKETLLSFLDASRKLSSSYLKSYITWLATENPNVFSYLDEKEQKRLLSSWPQEYIENEYNDEATMKMLTGYLESPKKPADWKCACNLMKLLAFSLSSRNFFIADAYNEMNAFIIRQIMQCLVKE
ncbi:MAG: TetR/AcrR family transcriptional regulator [Ruminococcus flavefaciens]|nr:TetR/AcrR family transcriptional regulator [Ruminococcus flavefaciens]